MIKGQIDIWDEAAVDLFAGSGGTSTGFEMATGRPMTVAINHNREAVLMHKTNHPWTEHYQADIFEVDPQEAMRGRPVGFLWASPDCRHFSKAKGDVPVEKKIRGLSWVVLRWAMDTSPRVIMMENVEEIQSWGPLMCVGRDKDGNPLYKPDPARNGETFKAFIGMLSTGVPADHPALEEACEFLKITADSPEAKLLIRGLGYALEYRELVAADYGAPTIRRRWYMIARRDGRPIVWPERTHAPIGSPEVLSGRLLPWRGAEEIIDWSLPMYSIFADRREIRRKYGVTVQRPLADNTMRRTICGVDKFTIRSGNPFLIPIGYGERDGQAPRVGDILRPLGTVVEANKHALVRPKLAPLLVEGNHAGPGHVRQLREPLNTVTARQTTGVTAPLLAPVTFSNTGSSVGLPASGPVGTIRTGGGQVLAAAHLTEYFGNGKPLRLTDPMHTVTSHDREALCAVHIQKYFGGIVGTETDLPLPTVTAKDHNAICAAHVVKFKGTNRGQAPGEPLQTITATCGEFAVAGTLLAKVDAGGDFGNWPKVRELLNRYCGYQLAEDEILLLQIGGTLYYIRDIFLRMLTARELHNAQGFPRDYIIDRDYMGNKITPTEAKAKCGNSVCPPVATALIRANLPEWCMATYVTMADLAEVMAV